MIAPRSDVVLVIGSRNSSNSNRLAELSQELGTPAYLVDDEGDVDAAWLDGADDRRAHVGRVGAGVAGAARCSNWLAERGYATVEEVDPDRGARALLAAGRRAQIPLAARADRQVQAENWSRSSSGSS